MYDNSVFQSWMGSIQQRVNQIAHQGALFHTQVRRQLNKIYLETFSDPTDRQTHNCRCCSDFLQRFGSVVMVGPDGSTWSICWDPETAPPEYKKAARALKDAVEAARISGPFVNINYEIAGSPEKGGWDHFSYKTDAWQLSCTNSVQQKAGLDLARESYRQLRRAMSKTNKAVLDRAMEFLQTGKLNMGEKFMKQLQWFIDLNIRPDETARQWDARIWHSLMLAPVGYAGTGSSVLSVLFDDIAARRSSSDIIRRFNNATGGLNYQRPKTAPAEQNIERAEKIVADIGLAPAFERRYARLEELPLIWKPSAPTEQPKAGGVFDMLKSVAKDAELPVPQVTTTVTWEKFLKVTADDLQELELYVPASRAPFIAVTAATNPDAPKLFKWDHPFAWYMYNDGSHAAVWSLLPNNYYKVTGISVLPCQFDGFSFDYKGVILYIEGAKDTRNNGLAIFPQCIRPELHGVRSVIEAFSARGELSGREEASACGWFIPEDKPSDVLLRVNGKRCYKIDRWD